MIKMVPRGVSATADAYLTPILRKYLDGFFAGFDEGLKDAKGGGGRVEFMGSDGGLLDLRNFSGLKSILSGPAGGVVGYALTSWDEKRRTPIIGCVLLFLFSSQHHSAFAHRHYSGSTLAGPPQTSRVTPADTRSCTRRLPRVLQYLHRSSISIPSQLAVARAWRSGMGSSRRGRRVRVRILGLHATSASALLSSRLIPPVSHR